MSEKPKFNPADLIIQDYKIIREIIDCPLEFYGIKNAPLSNTLSLTITQNKSKFLIKSDLEFLVEAGDVNSNLKAILNFKIAFIFSIEKIKEAVLDKDNGSFEIDTDIGLTIVGVTYSTTRGLLLAKVKGTYFENFILPIVESDTLLEAMNKGKTTNLSSTHPQ